MAEKAGVEKAGTTGRPVITAAILQLGLLAQAVLEAERATGYVIGIDPMEFLPQPSPGWMFIFVTLALSVLAIVNFILLMTWLYKATRLIGRKATPPLNISPGWAIGWWFIPIANLIAPFMVMTELYNASRAPENWNKRGLPVLAILWWGATFLGIGVALAIRFGKHLTFDLPPPDLMYAGLYGFGTLRLLSLLALVTIIMRFQKSAAKVESGVENVF
jgi:hypothetical protein